jgi:cell wall-associated NlpC family hydrolase
MSYTPRPGDFGVVKTNGIIGKLIRVGTASRWNHAFIYIGDGVIVEANPTGVAITPLAKYPNIAWNQHDTITAKQRDSIIELALNEVGKPYAFIDISILFLRILGLRFVKPNKFWKKLSVQNGWFCSELVSYCYRTVGLTLINKKDDLVTPGDLAERLVYQ